MDTGTIVSIVGAVIALATLVLAIILLIKTNKIEDYTVVSSGTVGGAGGH